MKLLHVFKERAPIFIELAWPISLSSASRLRSWSQQFRIVAALLAPSALTAVHAQHASDYPLAAVNDAFGLTPGLES
jgi:hypothetical protein